jgi:hypothetical protein
MSDEARIRQIAERIERLKDAGPETSVDLCRQIYEIASVLQEADAPAADEPKEG